MVGKPLPPPPLAGVRVVDLSLLLPGPYCSWYLQGLGAEVIKIERPGRGDWLREIPPFDAEGRSAWFSALNAGKRSVCLDLRQPAAVAALHAMLATADVLIEGFRPGVMARLGLDIEALCAAHPRLVVASITGFGQHGPLADQPGHDLGYCGYTGQLALGARNQGVPPVPPVQVADIAGGALTAALRIVAALFARQGSGQGAWLDVSMTEGALAFVAPQLAATAVGGAAEGPGQGMLTGGLASYRMYRCRDGGVLAVAALEPQFWAHLVAQVDPQLSPDPDTLGPLFLTRTRDEWAALLSGACCTPVLELAEVLDHPLHRLRGSIVGEGAHARVRPPFPGAQSTVLQPAPELGAHTQQVLREVGFDPTALEAP